MRRPPLMVALLATLLLGAGTLHFVTPRFFDAVMPRALPPATHRPLTYASGVAELAAGALLLPRRTRRLGGWLAFWTFVGVLPANVDVALRGGYEGLPGFASTTTAAWLRIPLQLPLIWASWAIAKGSAAPRDRSAGGPVGARR